MASLAPEKQLLDTAVEVLKDKYAGWTGPVTAAYAPGLVNILGDETGPHAGFVLSMCLELGTAVVGAEAQGDEVCLYSTSVQEELRCDLSCVSQAKGSGEGEWVGIAKACIAKFSDGYKEKEGKPLGAQGFRAVIASNIPHCSDLGDAASLVVAIMTFLEELFRCRFKAEQKAQLCQAVMNTATNLARGAIDCLVPCMGKHGNFLMIDPRSLEAVNVPSGSGVVKVLVTKTKQKTPVDQKECAARVATCKEALAAVNRHTDSAKEALRDVEMSELQDTCDKGGLGEVALRCARHVLTENRRCQDAAAALKRRDFAAVGKLMHASHVSMKEDYGARSDELDALVACACSQDGVLGSRMVANATCVLSIVDAGKIEAVKAALSEAYSSKFGEACDHTTSDASAGARRVDMALYFPEQHGYECIVQANILKAQGNECFKAGEPSKALEKYNRIPLAIKGLVKKQGGGGGGGMGAMMGMPNNKDEQALTDEQRNEVNTLWQTCHINRAMCYIKLEKWDKGVDACTEAISSGSDDVKAYFRRGKCYRHLGELDKAREDLNGVAARNPDDINVQRELLEVEKRQKMQDDRAKKTFVKMFA